VAWLGKKRAPPVFSFPMKQKGEESNGKTDRDAHGTGPGTLWPMMRKREKRTAQYIFSVKGKTSPSEQKEKDWKMIIGTQPK